MSWEQQGHPKISQLSASAKNPLCQMLLSAGPEHFSHVCTPEWQLDTLLHLESGFLLPNVLQPALARISLLSREFPKIQHICSQVPPTIFLESGLGD